MARASSGLLGPCQTLLMQVGVPVPAAWYLASSNAGMRCPALILLLRRAELTCLQLVWTPLRLVLQT